jgi:hypothetical protein
MNIHEAYNTINEGKLDDFDKAYDVYHNSLKGLIKAFSNAATDKKAVNKMKKAVQDIETAIDAGKMKD